MQFEFDPAKSTANEAKHGIDFQSARALWADTRAMTFPVAFDGEPRSLVVGRIGAKHWTAVVTYRGTRIRIISVRRARDDEIEDYQRGGI